MTAYVIMHSKLPVSDDFSKEWQVSYCLSKTLPPRCQLQLNLPLIIIVIVLNAGMVVCAAVVVTRMKDCPLVTVGDAIASFVENPVPQTKNMCLIPQQHLKDYRKIQKLTTCSSTIQSTIQCSKQRARWMSTASQKHWIIVGSL